MRMIHIVMIDYASVETAFAHFIVNRTEFDGFDFSAHRLEPARRNYVIHDPTSTHAQIAGMV